MKKIGTFLTLLTLIFCSVSCYKDNDEYLTLSGEGSLNVEDQDPDWLYRMVIKADSSQITTYLLGAYCTVDQYGDIYGNGAIVYFSVDNTDSATSISPMNVNISETPVYYTQDIDLSTTESIDSSDSFTELTSGTIVVQLRDNTYTIKILGMDSEGNDIVITYTGYVYASFFSDSSTTL